MFIQLVGSFFGVFIVYLLAKFHLQAYQLFPSAANELYVYFDTLSQSTGYQFARILAQEIL
jgi:glycerol uptake facilitator-like aquaporin